MTAFTGLDDLVAKSSGANVENLSLFKDGRVAAAAASAPVAGRWSSMWQYNGAPGGAGAAPGGTARNPTRTTAGSLGQTNPGGGRQKFLTGASGILSIVGTLHLFDRLADFSGLNATTITAQNTTSLAVSRYTGTAAAGNRIFLEIYTIIGSTSTTVTASYTNESGTSGRTTVATAFGNTGLREAQRLIPLPLQAGDYGVRSVESVTVLASTLTAGDFGVTIVRPITHFANPTAAQGAPRDFVGALAPMPEVMTDAALFLAYLSNSASVPQAWCQLGMVES
jgi:hypothetical protein